MNENGIQTYREEESRLWQYYGARPCEQFLTLERPRVRVRVQEIGEGRPLLFVHGGPNAGTTWAPLVAQMQDFRCLVLDRPGCGLSEPVDYGVSGLRRLASDVLHSLLDTLEIERLSIVASSMGGLWSLWLAQAHPLHLGRRRHLWPRRTGPADGRLDARLHLIPESGHLPWLDAAEEVSALSREFLRAADRVEAKRVSATTTR